MSVAASAGEQRGSPARLPGLHLERIEAAGVHVATRRVGDNQWLLAVGDVDLAAAPSAESEPGAVARLHAAPGGSAFVARIELDSCGAWATLACTADLRPLVVRRAGWVDERGDAVVDTARPWPEDRVGLGPGDAIVVGCDPSWAATDRSGTEGDPRAFRLLGEIGQGPHHLGRAVGAAAVMQVPPEVAGAGAAWVAEATGVPEEQLVLPGYPLGDTDPGRWKLPPAPPRRATFELGRDLARLRDLRGVVTRLVRSWRLEERVDVDALSLLTSEVAANALVHTGTEATVVVCYLGHVVRVGVVDGSSQGPAPRELDPSATSGRGLAMVDAGAAAWGVRHLAAGKEIWFELGVG